MHNILLPSSLSMGASPASNDPSSATASLPLKRSRTHCHQHKHHHLSGGHHHKTAASSVGESSSITPFDLLQHFDLRPASGDALKDENCSICTFNLAGSGMYNSDDDDSDGDGNSARQVAELKGCQHFFYPGCLMPTSPCQALPPVPRPSSSPTMLPLASRPLSTPTRGGKREKESPLG